MPTRARRTNKYVLYWVAMGLASATGYLKGSPHINNYVAAAVGVLAFLVAGVVLKMNLDDREALIADAYERGFRHGQETRLIRMASDGTHPGEGRQASSE